MLNTLNRGLTTKIHTIADGLGNPVEFLLSKGNDHDSIHAIDFHDFDSDTATSSTFILQRENLLLRAFEFLLHEFTATASRRYFHGYCRLP